MDESTKIFSGRDVADLLCMPQVLVDLIEAALGGDGSQQFAEIILRDTALAVKVISAAKKTGIEPLDPFEPVSSAVQILGEPMVVSIALQAARQVIQYNFTPQELSFQYSLWFSSQVSSLAARCLAPSVNYPHVEEAQLSGLLLNLGIHTLFAREGGSYIDLEVSPWSSSVQCGVEEEQYKINHLQVADQLLESWQLDSFLADAIKFLHAEISQVEKSGVLLKIARLVQQFCQNSQHLTAETEVLASRLFGFSKSETHYLFDWFSNLSPRFGTFLTDHDKLQTELATALARLTELSFILADQAGARTRLGGAKNPEELVAVARNLYLENSPATDAIFFFVDQESHKLAGIMIEGQPGPVAELMIPLDGQSSLLSAALLAGSAVDSLQPPQPLSVTDHLLLRLCKSRAMSCHPFYSAGQPLGAVVLGIDSPADAERLQSLWIKMVNQVISVTMAQLLSASQEHFNDAENLLRRVSHEINDPLTIIGNYAGALNQLLADSTNRRLTESIETEVKRIDETINYYLDKQEIPEFTEYSVDLNQLIRDTVASLTGGEFEARQIVPKLDLQSRLDKIVTNPVLVKKILVDLLRNGAGAVDAGGLVQVVSRDGYSSDRGRHVEIIVRDDGPGIDLQQQEEIFQSAVGANGGGGSTGGRLSCVKRLVDDLGGWISCHSSTESGTSFHLQISCGSVR